jgi:Kef-type K+ transport system membrane component KefB
LTFSRDPHAVKTEARFDDLYAFFAPFFFIGIGLQIELDHLGSAAVPSLWLVAAASIGKIAGTALPALMTMDISGAFLIAASMIPRAEIAMIIAQRGLTSGVLSQDTYAALLIVAGTTCVAATWLVHGLLARWPQHPITKRKEQRE